MPRNSYYERIYSLIREIPSGKVATYGQLAKLAGCTARQAGYVLAATPSGEGIPWHRVINAQGKLSVRSSGEPSSEQTQRLLAEGVIFNPSGRIALADYQWDFDNDFEAPDIPGIG